jgi:UDP-N-acetylglucosamine pyrophosphorylase
MDKQIIILAAGKGSRMNSELPTVMHKVGGTPMLERVMHNCKMVTDNLILVYSQHLEPYLSRFEQNCKLINQKEQLGTAHAVAVAKDLFNDQQYIGVIYGDNPLITSDIIEDLFKHLKNTNSKAVTLAFEYEKENQYGRIIVDKQGNFKNIVETKFANDLEKKITLCNSGIMAFAPGIRGQYIDKCLVSDLEFPEKELYLTNIIEICASFGEKVSCFKSDNPRFVVGVKSKSELDNAKHIINKD